MIHLILIVCSLHNIDTLLQPPWIHDLSNQMSRSISVLLSCKKSAAALAACVQTKVSRDSKVRQEDSKILQEGAKIQGPVSGNEGKASRHAITIISRCLAVGIVLASLQLLRGSHITEKLHSSSLWKHIFMIIYAILIALLDIYAIGK